MEEIKNEDSEAGILFIHEVNEFDLNEFPDWLRRSVELFENKDYCWTPSRYKALKEYGYGDFERREILSSSWTESYSYEDVKLGVEEQEEDIRRVGISNLNERYIKMNEGLTPISRDIQYNKIEGTVSNGGFYDKNNNWSLQMHLKISDKRMNDYWFKIEISDQYRFDRGMLKIDSEVYDKRDRMIYSKSNWNESKIPYDKSVRWIPILKGIIKRTATSDFEALQPDSICNTYKRPNDIRI